MAVQEVENKPITDQQVKAKINLSLTLKWSSALIIPILLYFLTPSLSYSIRIFLATTLWAILTWAFELVPSVIVAVVLPVLYILSGITLPATAFSGFASTTIWITLGGLIMATAVIQTGLAKRIAYRSLALTGTNLVGIMIGLIIAGFILTPLIPVINAKVALLAAAVVGILQALEIKPGSKAGTAISMASFYAVSAPTIGILTGGGDITLAGSLISKGVGLTISWGQWAGNMLVPAIIWSIISVFTVLIIRPEKLTIDKNILIGRYRELGPMSKKEKLMIVYLLIVLVLLATDKIHKIDSAWILTLASALLFFPGLNILKKEDISKVNFILLFFIAGTMIIGTVASSTGTTGLIIKSITPLFAGKSTVFVLVATYIFAIVAHMMTTTIAAVSAFVPPIVELYKNLGLNPLVGGYTMVLGINPFLFPYQLAPFMIIYAYGYINFKDAFKINIFRYLAGILFLLAIVIPFWKLIGLL